MWNRNGVWKHNNDKINDVAKTIMSHWKKKKKVVLLLKYTWMFQNPTAGAVEEVRYRVLFWVSCVIEGGQVSACVSDVMFQIGFGWTPGKSKRFWFCWTLKFTFWGQSYWSRGQLKFRVYKRHDSVLISCLSAKERSSQWVNPANRHICNQTQRERDKEKTFFLFHDRSFKAQNAQSNPLQAKRSISLILCFIAEMKLL